MKSYQVDCTVITKHRKGGKCDGRCYNVGLFVRAFTTYNAVISAYNRLREDFNDFDSCSIHKVEEVTCYDEES